MEMALSSAEMIPRKPEDHYDHGRMQSLQWRENNVGEIEELERTLSTIEKRIVTMKESLDKLTLQHANVVESILVLQETMSFFDEVRHHHSLLHPTHLLFFLSRIFCIFQIHIISIRLSPPLFYSHRRKIIGNADQTMRSFSAMKRPTFVKTTWNLASNLLTMGLSVLWSVESDVICSHRFITGSIPCHKFAVFERIVWRTLHGNVFITHTDLMQPLFDPKSLEMVKKCAFVVFTHGTRYVEKTKRIAEALGGRLCPMQSSIRERQRTLAQFIQQQLDLHIILQNTHISLQQELLAVSQYYYKWKYLIHRDQSIYHTMNLFNYDITRQCLIAEAWCPTNALNPIIYALSSVGERSGSSVPPMLHELPIGDQSDLMPPTFHRTNKWTQGFQAIIDAYGIAKYREINPGLFTVITFPFLFAVMFGDLGHGMMMTIFALWMVVGEKRLSRRAEEDEVGLWIFSSNLSRSRQCFSLVATSFCLWGFFQCSSD